MASKEPGKQESDGAPEGGLPEGGPPEGGPPEGGPPEGGGGGSGGLPRQQIIKTWVIFVLLIGLFFGGLEALSFVDFKVGDKRIHFPITKVTSDVTAQITAGLMSLFGDETVKVRNGNHITSQIFSVRIIFECTGLLNVFILWAAVLAFPSSWLAKAIGLVGGTLALLVANQVRLLTLVYLGPHVSPEFFDTFHIVFWQTLMIFITLGIWLFWASKFVTPLQATPTAEEEDKPAEEAED